MSMDKNIEKERIKGPKVTKEKTPKLNKANNKKKRAKKFKDILELAGNSEGNFDKKEGIDLDVVLERRLKGNTNTVTNTIDKGSKKSVLERVRQREREASSESATVAGARGDDARSGEVAEFVAGVVAELSLSGERSFSERRVAQAVVDSGVAQGLHVSAEEAAAAVAQYVAVQVAAGRATRRRGVFALRGER